MRFDPVNAIRRIPGSIARQVLGELDARKVRREVEPRLLSQSRLQEDVARIVTQVEAASIIRPGEFELRVLREYLTRRLVPHPRDWGAYSEGSLRLAHKNAGLAIESPAEADAFCENFLGALLQSNLIILFPWTEWVVGTPALENKVIAAHKDFDPFAAALSGCEPWTRSLAGKTVAVVSSFSATIRAQHRVLHTVSGVRELMPNFSLIAVDAPVTFAGRMTDSSWHSGLTRVKQELDSIEYDVLLASAGSYGPSLAHHAKSAGKVGLHIGALGQLLFGIAGTRFLRPGSQFLSSLEQFGPIENWVRPSAQETPAGFRQVENGAYW